MCCEKPIGAICLDEDRNIPLAMAYVKNQEFCGLFDPMRALSAGTVFQQLYKPWMIQAKGCIR